jgi:hypothetical protein
MIRKDQAIRHNDILSPARRKHHNLSNIIWSQRLTSTVVDESQSQHTKAKYQMRKIRLTSTQHQLWTYLHRTSPSKTQSQPDQDPHR